MTDKSKRRKGGAVSKVTASAGAAAAAASPTPAPQPLTFHTLHLVFLLGILQPAFLLLALFYLPQRAAAALQSATIPLTTTATTAAAGSPFERGWQAIARLYDNPDHLSGDQLRNAVLPSGAIAVFITQAWLTRAVGKWIATEQRRTRPLLTTTSAKGKNSNRKESNSNNTFEQLALTLLSLPVSTLAMLGLLVALLGAPIPFTSSASVTATGQVSRGEHTLPTLALAFHLALLITLIPAHVLGTDLRRWDEVFLPAASPASSSDGNDDNDNDAARLKKRADASTAWHAVLFYPAVGALAGALLGSYGLALDWGRPWQIWPVPPLLGSTAGVVLGNWLGIHAWTGAAWTALAS
ncbi:Glycosylphosphatidylinositol (GPI) anchor assembly protein [Tilletia horrida]|nr:Glycosylphosphatidylinositol (GPI) anchor assembly protein [Tilletia horrida]